MMRRLRSLLWMMAGFLGALPLIGAPSAPPASAQNLNFRQPNAVPASWMRYAQLVQLRFKEWLSADDPIAYRFHQFLENRVVNEDTPPEALVVKVWIAKDGKVQRVDFAPLKDAQANDDLHAILSSGNIGEAPPPDMLQPLQLRVALSMAS
jgi:hypothetical protein